MTTREKNQRVIEGGAGNSAGGQRRSGREEEPSDIALAHFRANIEGR